MKNIVLFLAMALSLSTAVNAESVITRDGVGAARCAANTFSMIIIYGNDMTADQKNDMATMSEEFKKFAVQKIGESNTKVAVNNIVVRNEQLRAAGEPFAITSELSKEVSFCQNWILGKQ